MARWRRGIFWMGVALALLAHGASAQSSAPGSSDAPDDMFEITLQAPELTTPLGAGDVITLHREEFRTFQVIIVPRRGHVNYGSILSSINGESADSSMNIVGLAHGYRCEFHIPATARAHLHRGENLIRIAFHDTWNRPHSAQFRIVLAPESTEPQNSSS
jgi:hypothetical protein